MAGRMGAIACSYEDLPAGADVVVVCSAPQCHAGHALHAIEAGAAVVIEKPLCSTLADADALVEAELAGARIGYAENLAYAPIVQQLLAAIADMGELQHLEVRTLQSRPTWGEFLTEAWGGGALFDLGVTRSPSRCWRQARRWCRSRRRSTAPTTIRPMRHAEVTLTFDGGFAATVVSSGEAVRFPSGACKRRAGPGDARRGCFRPCCSSTTATRDPDRPRHGVHPQARAVRLRRARPRRSSSRSGATPRPLMDAAFGATSSTSCAAYASRTGRRHGRTGPLHWPSRQNAAQALAWLTAVARRQVVVSGRVQGVWYRDELARPSRDARRARVGRGPQRWCGRRRLEGDEEAVDVDRMDGPGPPRAVVTKVAVSERPAAATGSGSGLSTPPP